MTKLIIFDFEVFAYDTLLGARIIEKNKDEIVQTWSLNEIRKFYFDNKDAIWIGHNNSGYDNFILQGIVKGLDERQIKNLSDEIISGKRKFLDIEFYYWDLISLHFGSLKAIECVAGENISTSDVDFDLNRPLNNEEKLKTESYNRDDIERTYKDFVLTMDEFTLRLDVIEEFGLPMTALRVTGTQLAEMVLHAKKIDGIEECYIKPKLYDNLRLKNEDVRNFYLNEEFAKKGKNCLVTLCGTKHKLGAGGIHAAKEKYHCKHALYFDVSGYYNLVMINYDLLPRSIPEKYRAFYKYMYEEQLKLKKTNPGKRWVYKIILLSVFGAMTNPYCKFYDPYRGRLVTITGQIFLVDLLEKLEGKVTVIQSNTDGVIAELLPGISREEVIEIINEWQTRTGFVLKLEDIYDIQQRDVNCYMYRDNNGEIHALGEALKYYEAWDNPLLENSYNAKEPPILQYMIVDYFMNNKLPEQVCEEHKRKLRMFHYVAKKMSYSYCKFEEQNRETGETTLTNVKAINRVFARKDDENIGMIYKYKVDGSRSKIPCLPDSVFIYNQDILNEETIDELQSRIDWQYYIDRGYERIQEFVKIPKIKDII